MNPSPHEHRDPVPADFVGKTIAAFDGSCVNIWHLRFTDGSAFAIQCEGASDGIPYMELCEQCAEPGTDAVEPASPRLPITDEQRDGRLYLVCAPGYEPEKACWHDGAARWFAGPYGRGSKSFALLIEPTHYMPLPEPLPAIDGASEGIGWGETFPDRAES